MPQRADPLAAHDLAAFAVTMEIGSVHGAADALALTPSAVTKRIQSLERRLAVRLFDRGRLGMRPTTAARVLYPEARHALTALEQAEAAVIEHRERSDVALQIAASHTIGEFLLPVWLATFRGGSHAVRFEVDIVNSAGVLAAVREQRAMVGFVEGVDALAEVESILVHRDEIVVVVAPAHRWAKRTSLRAQELSGDGYLARERGSGSRAVVDAALAAKGVSLAPSLEVASAQSLKRALDSGGFAMLSRLAVDTEQRVGSLCTIPVRDAVLTRELRAIRASGRPASRTGAAFWNWLRDQLHPDS